MYCHDYLRKKDAQEWRVDFFVKNSSLEQLLWNVKCASILVRCFRLVKLISQSFECWDGFWFLKKSTIARSGAHFYKTPLPNHLNPIELKLAGANVYIFKSYLYNVAKQIRDRISLPPPTIPPIFALEVFRRNFKNEMKRTTKESTLKIPVQRDNK